MNKLHFELLNQLLKQPFAHRQSPGGDVRLHRRGVTVDAKQPTSAKHNQDRQSLVYMRDPCIFIWTPQPSTPIGSRYGEKCAALQLSGQDILYVYELKHLIQLYRFHHTLQYFGYFNLNK